MTLSRSDRALTAWMLYFCILFSALACSLSHGQMVGLQLSGVAGTFCSSDGNNGPTLDGDFAAKSGSSQSGTFSCPLCGTAVLGLALLFCLAWLRRSLATPGLPRDSRSKAPPRYSWPSANPRASPLTV